MKRRKLYLLTGVLIICSLILFACSGSKNVAKSASAEDLEVAIRQNNWIFYAENISPQKGRTRQLAPNETAYLHRDTLNSSLPYFGEAYAGADVLTNQSPLAFISTDFTAIKDRDKSGAWLVTVRPKDYKAVQSIVLTVYDNGNAQMIVTMTNRSPISFTGHVTPRS